VEDVWREHHALALPSRSEGLPLALLEAMLCGRPAVVTDVGGNAEAITDGVSGFLADAPTVGAFDEALERAWERRADWSRMGRAAAAAARAIVPADAGRELAGELQAIASERDSLRPGWR
jgi:glycosyltransferase involved in cell wall biosynthesis